MPRGATVVVSAEATELRTRPDEQSRAITNVPWLTTLDVDSIAMKRAPAGWIPVSAQIPGASDMNAKPMWVRLQDVVIGDNFRKVTSCWPIKSIEIEMGDSAAGFRFTPDGSGTFAVSFDESRPTEKTSGPLHIYLDNNILMLKGDSPRAPKFPLLGLKLSQKLVFAYGLPAKEVEVFTNSELSGCKAIGIGRGKLQRLRGH